MPDSTTNLPVILCCRDEDRGRRVTAPGWELLSRGGNALDAVLASGEVAELDPEDHTVGYSGLPNESGVVQLDASCMYGPTHRAGAVAALEGIKTPGKVARLVMEETRHVMLVGNDALQFALAHGFKAENLLTPEARKEWEQWRALDAEEKEKGRPHGTINVLGTQPGNIAGVTSTSGWRTNCPTSEILPSSVRLYVDNGRRSRCYRLRRRGNADVRQFRCRIRMRDLSSGSLP